MGSTNQILSKLNGSSIASQSKITLKVIHGKPKHDEMTRQRGILD